ncbi:MAG: hypothetical protein IPL46_18535 [Saprospiraceae bacterium]|nr:hypothetical protein [Saprospiraceae bacterium]
MRTVLVITVGMLILDFVTNWTWPLYFSLAIGILGLTSNYLAARIDYLWMKLAWVLSLIIPNIVLSIIFFFMLTPLAILSRLFGEKDKLSIRNTRKSIFKEVSKEFDKGSFEKTW